MTLVTSTGYFLEAVKGIGYFLFAGSSARAMPGDFARRSLASSTYITLLTQAETLEADR